MFRRWTLLVATVILLAALPAHARDSLLGQLYGRGAHAYFSGDFVKAHGLLTAAIEGETRDPRPYYFRGLVYLRLNRPEQAQMDFSNGAQLEAGDSNGVYDVSKALQRVQGRTRLMIERYRADARLSASKRAKAIHHARYEAIRSQEPRVLRTNVVLTPERIATPEPIVTKKSAVVRAASRAANLEENPFDQAPPDAASGGAPEKSSKLLNAFGSTLGEVVGKRIGLGEVLGKLINGITGAFGKGLPGGNIPSPGITPPAPTGGSPFDDPLLGDQPAPTPEKKAPAKEGQGGAQDNPFDDTPLPEVKTPAGGGLDQGTQDDSFKGVQAPAVQAPAKATGQAPLTKPGSSAKSHRGAAPALQKPLKIAQPRQKRATKNPPPSLRPADGSPFVSEPLPAPAKILPAKKTKKSSQN